LRKQQGILSHFSGSRVPEKKISPPKKSAQLDIFSSYPSDFLSHMMEFLKEKSSSESAFQDATRGCVPVSKRRHRG
jgi:hypothetical protein